MVLRVVAGFVCLFQFAHANAIDSDSDGLSDHYEESLVAIDPDDPYQHIGQIQMTRRALAKEGASSRADSSCRER